MCNLIWPPLSSVKALQDVRKYEEEGRASRRCRYNQADKFVKSTLQVGDFWSMDPTSTILKRHCNSWESCNSLGEVATLERSCNSWETLQLLGKVATLGEKLQLLGEVATLRKHCNSGEKLQLLVVEAI